MNPSDPGYYHAGRKVVASWPEKDPVPEVLNTDPRPDVPVPGPVRELQALGLVEGWDVRIGYSRSPARAVKVGTYKMVETWGVWASAHPDTGYRWYAMYERSIGAKTGWKWDRTGIWKLPTEPRFVDANVTDLKEFIALRGSVNLAWFKGINARVADQAARAKARPATKKLKEGNS
jgi:hypothetical protein